MESFIQPKLQEGVGNEVTYKHSDCFFSPSFKLVAKYQNITFVFSSVSIFVTINPIIEINHR